MAVQQGSNTNTTKQLWTWHFQHGAQRPECAPPLTLHLWRLKSTTSAKNFKIPKVNQRLKRQGKLLTDSPHMLNGGISLLCLIQQGSPCAPQMAIQAVQRPWYLFSFYKLFCTKNHQESCSKIQQCMAIYSSFLLYHYGKFGQTSLSLITALTAMPVPLHKQEAQTGTVHEGDYF